MKATKMVTTYKSCLLQLSLVLSDTLLWSGKFQPHAQKNELYQKYHLHNYCLSSTDVFPASDRQKLHMPGNTNKSVTPLTCTSAVTIYSYFVDL